MTYRFKPFLESIYRLRGVTATDTIRILLSLLPILLLSLMARRISFVHKFVTRVFKPKSVYFLDLVGRLSTKKYLRVFIDKDSYLFIRSNDLHDDFSIATLLHEPLVARVFLPQYGDTVIDIGAHIGSYTVRIAKAVGEEGLVIAFEPDPDNFKLLLLNLKVNKLRNVIALPYAISNHSGTLTLHRSRCTGLHSTAVVPPGYIGSVKVKAITLDDIIKSVNIKRVDWIKIDVEGAEKEVLEGAIDTLKTTRNIVVEVKKENLRHIISISKSHGFKLLPISEGYVLLTKDIDQ